ncbi:MAG: ABC transporter ATP-binding protein [Bacteroidales bacterium]
MGMTMLELHNIRKSYPGFEIMDLSLRVEKGEYFVLLGRSGSGKSMLLEIIAGLRSCDSGSVILNGTDITKFKIQERKTGLVFQDFALFPHLTVYDNIAYPLRTKGMKKSDIDEKVKDMAWEMNITSLLERRPDTLSGGERQRVAVSRTLVTSPDIILLDEPMASIDTPLRDDLRRLLRDINRKGMTIMHVTHDFREAIRLAHRMGVMHNGHLVQTGSPDEIFSRPRNRFVARFAGVQNFFNIAVERKGDTIRGKMKNGIEIELPEGNYGDDALIMIPNSEISASGNFPAGSEIVAEGVVREVNRAENGYEAYIESGDIFYLNLSHESWAVTPLLRGERVWITFPGDAVRVLQ